MMMMMMMCRFDGGWSCTLSGEEYDTMQSMPSSLDVVLSLGNEENKMENTS